MIREWVDHYWKLVDNGSNHERALCMVCFAYQLSSYDEDALKKELEK